MSHHDPLAAKVGTLQSVLTGLGAADIVRLSVGVLFPGRIALASSFGADSAVLLHMVAQFAPSTPVLFLDSGKLFAETRAYHDLLVARLGLSDVRIAQPAAASLAARDADGQLWQSNPDRCCAIRKVVPLDKALDGFDAWITGRKRFQTSERSTLAVFESTELGLIKINPLAAWTESDVESYLTQYDLPRHPLVAAGYRSIGCAPCTSRTGADEPSRAGRWRGSPRAECGIHLSRTLETPSNISAKQSSTSSQHV